MLTPAMLWISILSMISYGYCQVTVWNNASCGDTVSSEQLSPGEIHYYRFDINRSLNVNFDSCLTQSDIKITIWNEQAEDISEPYCPTGDSCGQDQCVMSYTQWSEKFTIPFMQKGPYSIKIETPWMQTDVWSYNVHIECSIPTINSSGLLSCGESLSGYLDSSSDIDYVYFNLSSVTNYSLLFDSCFSDYDTYLALMDMYFNVLYKGDDDGDCGSKEQLSASLMIPNLYILKISGYGTDPDHAYGYWNIAISCNETFYHPLPSVEPLSTAEPSPDFLATLTCNDAMSGYLETSADIDYIYFNLTSVTNYVLFDSCLSDYDTYLDLMDIDFNVLYEGDDDGTCYNEEQLLINSTVNPGLYILKISGSGTDDIHAYGNWYISVLCDEPPSKPQYILGVNFITGWLGAERHCEFMYGTTLATIITEEDMKLARDIIIRNNLWARNTTGLWMGMYHDVFNNTKLKWIDGTPCNYTKSGYWEDDIHNTTINDDIDPLYTYINTSLHQHNDDEIVSISAYLDKPYPATDYPWPYSNFGLLCNRMYSFQIFPHHTFS